MLRYIPKPVTLCRTLRRTSAEFCSGMRFASGVNVRAIGDNNIVSSSSQLAVSLAVSLTNSSAFRTSAILMKKKDDPQPENSKSDERLATSESENIEEVPLDQRMAPTASVAPATSSFPSTDTRNNNPGFPQYKRVGNVLIVRVTEYPFKFGWELNKILHELRIEFHGQVVIHPDIPEIRHKLFLVRHIVSIEMMDLDSVRKFLGIPGHIKFKSLLSGMGNGPSPQLLGNAVEVQGRQQLTAVRRQRLKDVMHRDSLELRLLAARKELKSKQRTGSINNDSSAATLVS